MMRIEGSVIGSDAAGSTVRFGSAGKAGCRASCRGCQDVRDIRLPMSVRGDRIRLTAGEHVLPRALSNTLLLPLAGFVSGAALAGAVGFGDPGALCSSITGLFVGIVLCRRLPEDSIQVQEVVHD